MDYENTAAHYNDYYFAHCCGRPYQRDDEWMGFFSSIAEHIVKDIGSKTILDAGCAMGFLVEALRHKGVEAWGVDISEYAIQKVHPDIQQYCWIGSVSELFPRKYDLIVCIEVLEHLPAQQVEQAIDNLCRHADDILFSSTPYDYQEATHFNVQPPEYWSELFAKQGFLRDVDFDSSFITPWATRFRRNHEPWHRVLRAYERKFWLLWKENQDVRSSTVQAYQQLASGEQSVQQLKAQVGELQAQLQQSSSQLEQCLQQSTTSQSQLQQDQAELEQCLQQATMSQSQLQQSQTALEQTQLQVQQFQIELERSQFQLQQTQTALEQSQLQFQQSQLDLQKSKNTIIGMQKSKFWKLRSQWVKFRDGMRLAVENNNSKLPDNDKNPKN